MFGSTPFIIASMKACFDDITALDLWRRDPRYWETLRNRNLKTPPAVIASSASDLKLLGIDPAPPRYDPVHLAVFDPKATRSIDGYRLESLTASLPSKSLCSLDSELLIASPELCFVRLARHTSIECLIEIGMELCGKYALVPEAKKGYVQRDSSLTTVKRISEFIENCHGLHGAKTALKALRHIKDGSESPMETRQYMLACLPIRFGSYGLSNFIVNGTLKLPERANRLDSRRSLRCDLLSDDEKTAVEYDSKEEHLGLAAFYRDNNKRNILQDMGVKVFIVSAAQIQDADQFDVIMRMVARATRKRLRHFPPEWEQRRDHLRQVIFRSMYAKCNLSPQLAQYILAH